MKTNDAKFLMHPLVRQIYDNNIQFYLTVATENYPIERLVSRPNRTKEDVIKSAFGILGDFNHVVTLLNKYHFGWREAF